jgi:hypothetical protein
MNTAGVVTIAFLAGIFLIVLVISVSASLWVSWTALKQMKALVAIFEASREAEASNREEQKRVLDASKSIFQGLKQEVKSGMDSQSAEIRGTLKMFEDGFRQALKNMNGKAMLDASRQSVNAVKRLESVAMALHDLVTSAGENMGTESEWREPARADEAAPASESKVSRSIYSIQDEVSESTDQDFDRITGGLFN